MMLLRDWPTLNLSKIKKQRNKKKLIDRELQQSRLRRPWLLSSMRSVSKYSKMLKKPGKSFTKRRRKPRLLMLSRSHSFTLMVFFTTKMEARTSQHRSRRLAEPTCMHSTWLPSEDEYTDLIDKSKIFEIYLRIEEL